jgi:hypothetical protein
MAIGDDGLMASADGADWSFHTGLNARLSGLCDGNGRILVVGNGGAILESADTISLSLSPSPQRGLILSLTGPAGTAYAIQSSTNLVSWQTITNLNPVQSTTVILDSLLPDSDHIFYRAYSE